MFHQADFTHSPRYSKDVMTASEHKHLQYASANSADQPAAFNTRLSPRRPLVIRPKCNDTNAQMDCIAGGDNGDEVGDKSFQLSQ